MYNFAYDFTLIVTRLLGEGRLAFPAQSTAPISQYRASSTATNTGARNAYARHKNRRTRAWHLIRR